YSEITDKRILAKIQQVIIEASQAESLVNISDLEEISGFPNYYRVKFDYRYRIGIYCENELIQFLRVDNREGFYKKFP
ncbi:MAG: hypothetical protein PHD39_09490, partial [Methylobacter tundripaludum]|nr:hypothetical protein [Methylobacter tundripaludum]